MSGQASTALTSPSRTVPGKLTPWQPGQSGNPGGRPKRAAHLRAVSLENFPDAVARLKQLINSKDDELAFRAVQFAYLYALGKPSESHQLAHLEAMQARTAELVVQQPQLPTEDTPVGPTLPSVSESAPSRETEATPPEALVPPFEEPVAAKAPLVATDVPVTGGVSVPTGFSQDKPLGMRCLFRGKEGRCETVAEEGGQWCTAHKTRLFEQIKI